MAKKKSTFLKIFGNRLNIIRNEMDLSISDMAKKLGLEFFAYNRLEKGEGGSLENMLSTLDSLIKEKYNANWILREDNTNESRRSEEMFFFSFDREKAVKNLNKIIKLAGENKSLMEDV